MTGKVVVVTAALLASVAPGEESRNSNHLLTVREVAELLQVRVSWVYGRLG
jgi:hypothetical protein